MRSTQYVCEPNVSLAFSVTCSPVSIADARPRPTDLLTYQPCGCDGSYVTFPKEGAQMHTNLVCNFRGFLCGGFGHDWGYV